MGYTDIRVIHYLEPGPQVHANTGRPQLATVTPQPGIGSPSCFSDCLSRTARPVSQRLPIHSTSTPAHQPRGLPPAPPASTSAFPHRRKMGLRLMLASRARAATSPMRGSNARSAAEAKKPYESVSAFCQNLNNSSASRAIVLIAQGSTPPKLCNDHSVKYAGAACRCRGVGAVPAAGDLVPQLVARHGTGTSTASGAHARNTLTQRAIQHAARAQPRAIACGRSGPPPPWGFGCPIPKTGRKT